MTAVSVLDHKTAGAIRQALSAASSGRIADAFAIGERALGEGGDPAALHALLGMLRFRTGDLETAVRHLSKAREARPDDLVVATNLASALAQLGREEEALGVVTEEAARSDPSLQLMRLRGFLAQQAGQYETSVRAYEHVVAVAPTDFESWNNLSNARRSLLDHEGTLEAAQKAVELAPSSAPVRLTYATSLEFSSRPDEAEREYRRMIDEFPQDPNGPRELFALLKTQYRDEEALDAIEEAVRRAPNDVELVLGLASHRLTRRHHAAAEEAYRRVLEIEPSNKLGWIGIATVYDQINRTDDLAGLVKEAEAAHVAPEGLAFVKAFDHRRANRYQEGLDALSLVPDELESARRQQLLGQLLEGAGRYDEAFESFERMNAKMLDHPTEPEGRAEAYFNQIKSQMDALTPEWIASWRAAKIDDRPSPAFLVGFPRSGTTLLDTILMSHPGTVVLEEEPCLMRANDALGGFEAIPGASDEQIRKARDTYFDEVRKITTLEPGKLLVDKMPLAMNQLPIIKRLFPDARIIVALRHPCDVVLSCYVTNFKANNAMVNFLWLDKAADLYALSFSYLEKARELLKPAVHFNVYENIVADRDRELRPLFKFLGLEWDDRVLDHQSTAKSRGHIKTASYAQVVEPIYKRSAGRWHNYRKHLEPILPVLEPWVTRFGYTL